MTIDLENAQSYVRAATDLDDLLSRMEAVEDAGGRFDAATSDCDVDVARLPKFSDDEPEDTAGMLSWDAERALWFGGYCDQSERWAIGPRADAVPSPD
ncbi:hypothetical protein CKO28_18855 [Rhodovibrio sodomensis]|uniref:Uncharacterized protein n=1 Tax=Rhodovibrio sodomensis TaxID=1088 RepID=A0ABS1DK10_9PROT|nr:hypothetical protein [Rhodovibrio sodomensis]MBK1670099.1 hypothetical protein [Rhodovibrio sodomensis]